MTNQERLTLIKERLTAALNPSQLEVIDESAAHSGHAGAQTGAGHFAVTIASTAFNNQSSVQTHRMVYAALNDLIPHEIHALKIKIIQ